MKNVIVACFIISGAINSISYQLLSNIQESSEQFYHPWFLLLGQFLFQSISVILFLILSETKKITPDFNEKKMNITYFTIPTILDLLGVVLFSFSMKLLSSGLVIVLRLIIILLTGLLSVMYLNNVLNRHNILGITFLICGIVILAISPLLFSNYDDENCNNRECTSSTQSYGIGIILCILSSIFHSFSILIEDKFIREFKINPIKVTGIQGIFGLLISFTLVILFQFVPCTATSKCREDFMSVLCAGNFFVEDSIYAFKQMADNGKLLTCVTIFIFNLGLYYKFFSCFVIKEFNSTTRAILDNIKLLIVFIFFILQTNDSCLKEKFHWLQIVGFILLILGTVVYIELVKIPFLGLNNQMQKQEESDGKLKKFDTQQFELESVSTFENNSINL